MTDRVFTNLFDIWGSATHHNPQALYAEMRREHPVYRATSPYGRRGFWFFTRYEDCVAVLKDQRFGKQIDKHFSKDEVLLMWGGESDPCFEVINHHLLNLDAPDHTRLRALVHKAFTPRMVENLRSRVQQIADEHIALMHDQPEVDLIDAYAFPIPIIVIAELLGVPSSDRAKFREWTKVLLEGAGDGVAAVMEFAMYMHELIDARQGEPRDDLLSALVTAEEAGDRLNREELLSMIFVLLVAGHETTVNLIGNGTLALIQHPDQKQKLIENPGLLKNAVEEMLRYNGPVETPTLRFAFEDVEVGGTVIPRGEVVLPALLAANRDPAVFPDPDRFDITRDPNPHIAFGFGMHFCVGAPLARLEAAIAFDTLLKHFPNITLNTTLEQLQWTNNLLIHGMRALPVRL